MCRENTALFLYNAACVPGHMAAYIYRQRQTRDMCCIGLYIKAEDRGASAQTLRAYTEIICPFKQLLVHIGDIFYPGAFIYWS